MEESPAERSSLVWRASFRVVLPLVRRVWGLKVIGHENVPRTGGVIIAFNHVSWWDGPISVLAAGFGRYLRYPTKAEAFRIPLLGWYLRQLGCFPLERHGSDFRAIRQSAQVLARGGCLGIFPEGTRSKTGLPGRPKAGVGFLARETGAPVVPARLINTGKFFTLGEPEARFGPPMRFEAGPEAGIKECQAFAESVMERIFAL